MTLTFVDGNATIGTTPYSIVTESTTVVGTTSQSKLRRMEALIDFSALAVGGVDVYRVDLYDAIGDDIVASVFHTWWIDQPQVLRIEPLLAWNVTDIVITKVSGTDRSIRYSTAEEIYAEGFWVTTGITVNAESTFSGTEYSLPNNSTFLTARTEDGYLQVWFHSDVASVQRLIRVCIYEKVDAGTQRVVHTWDLVLDANESFVSPVIAVHDGWDVTVDELNGNATTIDFSLRLLNPGGSGVSRSRVVNS